MCFKNLPIEFDAAGNATLKPGAANPYSYVEDRALVGAVHERGVAGPVHLVAVTDVDLGESADERVLGVDARRQPALAQRAPELHRGHHHGLVDGALGCAVSHR